MLPRCEIRRNSIRKMGNNRGIDQKQDNGKSVKTTSFRSRIWIFFTISKMECACNLLYLSFNLGVKKNKQKECVMFYAYLASYIIIHYAGMLRLLCQDEYLLEKK